MNKKFFNCIFSCLLCLTQIVTCSTIIPAEENTYESNQITFIEPQNTQYAHTTSSSSNGVTLKVEWNDPTLGKPTIFHVSAIGGSGNYKFRMDSPSYSNPNESSYESVADPSRGEWMNYTDECISTDYSFTMTASGTYNFRFYLMDKANDIYYLRVNTDIHVSNPNYPSINSIIQSAVDQCKRETDGSDYQKALWLHDWLLDQLDYDSSLKWSSAESALTRGLGTCQAYESAYSKLLTMADIENSETRDTYDGHTWNSVKLNGEWYQIDCTWDDTNNSWYDFDQRHLYFALTDELMALAHPGHSNIFTADNYITRSTNLTNNYFIKSGDAIEWAEKYKYRIQENLDANNTQFTLSADNASYPPSISGIQNGLIAYVLNEMSWSDEKHNISLSVTGSSNAFDFNIVYSDIDHIWDNGTIIKEATCIESGIKTYTCTICNKTKTETVEALGHFFSNEWIIDKPATCQNEGIKSYHCTRCNEKQNVTTISKLDHEWDNGKVITEPTYTSEGKTKYTCKNCSFTKEVKTERLEESREDQLARQNKYVLKDGTYTISSTLNNNFVLNIKNDSKSDNGNVQLNQDNSSNSQEFIVTHDSIGYVTFTNANSGKVLDVSSGKAENRRNIQQYFSNGTNAQKWIVEEKETGYVIMSALNSNYVIDLSDAIISEGRNVQLYKSNDNNTQRWNFIHIISKEDKLAGQNKNALEDGTYTISSTLNNNFILDIKNDSKADNGNVQLNLDNSSNSQEFIVTHDSIGYVTFTNANSGKVLDVSSGKAENRRNIQQYFSNGTNAQKWIVEKKETGYVIMSALNSDYVIDLSDAIISEGRNIQLYKSNDSNAQRWNFIHVFSKEDKLARQNKNALEDGTYTISSTLNNNFILDIKNDSKADNGNVQLNLDNSSNSQEFIVTHDSIGYVTFTNANSGKVLDVSSGKAENRRNIQQYFSNGTNAQKWIVEKKETGYVIMSALNSDYVIDLSDAIISEGRNIQLYKSNDSNAQRWLFY